MPGMGQPKPLSISQTHRFHIQCQPFITRVLRLAVIWKQDVQRLLISQDAEGFFVSCWVSFLFKIQAKWKPRDGTVREENQATKQGKEVLCHAFHWSSVQVRNRNWWAQPMWKPIARNLIITCKAFSKMKMFIYKHPFHCLWLLSQNLCNSQVIQITNTTPINHSIFEMF